MERRLMSMSIAVIIQARMGSNRLPGKVMKMIKGKTIIEHIIDRVKCCSMVDDIIIATTTNIQDDLIVEETIRLGQKIFRGSEQDVLSRYYNAATKYQSDIILRITSDCPLIDPILIDQMIIKYIDLNKTKTIDYLSNKIKPTYPRGLDVEIFSYKTLEKTFIEAIKDYEREHVTPYIYLNPEKFNMYSYENNMDFSYLRWTLDTKEDFELIKIIYDELYISDKIFEFKEVLKLVNDNPSYVEINKHIKQKELGE
jgi:spore coat polysaccharide biosynthesis protein SpsF